MKLIGTLVIMAVVLAAATAAANETSEQQIRLKDAPGRELTAARCTICHSVDYVEMNAAVMDQAGWQRSVQKMIERFGAPI
ncbi:MAG: hypothetical protein ACREXP_24265, partial [Steroidobacteraceae bacterium]